MSPLKLTLSVLLPRQSGGHQQGERLAVQEVWPGLCLRKRRGLLSPGSGQLQSRRGKGHSEAGSGGQNALGDGDNSGRGRGLQCIRHIKTVHV